MNYKLVQDENKLKEFINWLPKLEPHQQYYICLFARKKYLPNGFLKNDKSQLARKTATKERIFEKIKQMEIAIGEYKYEGIGIPQEALAIYITPNPRDLTKAGLLLMKQIADNTISGKIYNPRSAAMNAIQISGDKKYFDIDIDLKGNEFFHENDIQEIIKNIQVFLNKECLTFVKTRGGLHCLVELEKINHSLKKNWYQNIQKLQCEKYEIMMNSDGLIPCIGTHQGGFTPHFIDF